MTAKVRLRELASGWAVCLLAGCGTSAGVPFNSAPDGTADGSSGSVVFEDDADAALAALPFVEGELLVQPYPGADAQALSDLYDRTGAVVAGELNEIGLTVLKVPNEQLAPIAAELASSQLIENIHKNYVYEPQETPDDPMFARQPHLTQIRATEAWDVTVGSEEIVIAIVDTGVEWEHPDLAENIADGWNVYDENADFGDVLGHGTHAAGVAAAVSNNGTGVTGVAWESPILAVRATDDAGQATSRHIAAGILWAVGNGAKVINVSFAPLWSNSLVRSAAEQAYNRGSLVVISAGNGGGFAGSSGYAEALFVGGIDGSNEIASFSDRGKFVDLVAPGTGIRSTSLDASYRMANGTSYAAPIVSGVAALAWAVNPDLRPVTIAQALIDSAVDLGTVGKDTTFGYGAVDAAGAVEAASEAPFVRDTTPPTLSITRPSNGATLSGRSTVSLTATDTWGVADVVMSVDGLPFASDTRAPYRFVVDTAAFGPGEHEFSFVATDLAGNASETESVTVEFGASSSNGSAALPQIVFHSPESGARVSGNVTITATVSAKAGLAIIEWLVDGRSGFATAVSGQSSRVTYLWHTSGVSTGSHTVSIVATDTDGLQTTGHLDLIKR